jgi:NADH dehydrogenase [ubiquinone] 1 alpha subcomplex assembly factor 7
MIGVWCLVAWMNLGRPPKLRLVELGPGRGTLMADLLRGAGSFPEFVRAVEVELVEISPALRRLQWATLKCKAAAGSSSGGGGGSSSEVKSSSSRGSSSSGSGGGDVGDNQVFEGVSGLGEAATAVRWRAALDEVAAEGLPAIYLAHEFFDALPVHQFVKDKGGRCGVGVGVVGCLGCEPGWPCGHAPRFWVRFVLALAQFTYLTHPINTT